MSQNGTSSVLGSLIGAGILNNHRSILGGGVVEDMVEALDEGGQDVTGRNRATSAHMAKRRMEL